MKPNRILFFDTETGGIGKDAARQWSLIQLGAIIWDKDNPGGGPNFECVINEELAGGLLSLDPEAMKVNGFTVERIREEGISPIEATLRFLRWAWTHDPKSLWGEEKINLGGHNISYDTDFLFRLFSFAGLGLLYDQVFNYRYTDTASIARFLIQSGVVPLQDPKSSSLFEHFGCTPSKPHDARSDAIATAVLYERMMTLIRPSAVLELVDVDGQKARWDKAKGILIDPPFGPWPR